MEQLIEIVSTKIYSFSYLLLTFISLLQISVWCTLFLILFKSYYIKFERSCATSLTWEIFPIKHKMEQSYDHMNNLGKYFWLCFVGNPRLISLTTYHSIRQNQPSVFDDAGCGEDFEIMSMCFRHFAWPFIWTNLNPLYQKNILCQVWLNLGQWFWRRQTLESLRQRWRLTTDEFSEEILT